MFGKEGGKGEEATQDLFVCRVLFLGKKEKKEKKRLPVVTFEAGGQKAWGSPANARTHTHPVNF